MNRIAKELMRVAIETMNDEWNVLMMDQGDDNLLLILAPRHNCETASKNNSASIPFSRLRVSPCPKANAKIENYFPSTKLLFTFYFVILLTLSAFPFFNKMDYKVSSNSRNKQYNGPDYRVL